MSFRSVTRAIFWTAVAIALVFHLGAGWYHSGLMIEESFQPAPEAVSTPSGDYRVEQVSYEAPLGEFDAWYLPSFRKTWVIHVHGLNSTPGDAEHLFERLQEAGYPQLAITYRNDEAQPADPDGYHRYGSAEHEEIAAAVAHAQDHGAESIVLSGFGAGASHVLAYLARSNLDAVRAAILDSPITDLGAAIDAEITSSDIPVVGLSMPVTVASIARFFTALRIDVNWRTVDYVDDASSLRRPVLVHHGTEDGEVPIAQSVSFAEASPSQVTLLQVEGAGHLGSYGADPEKYVDEILSFLSQVG